MKTVEKLITQKDVVSYGLSVGRTWDLQSTTEDNELKGTYSVTLKVANDRAEIVANVVGAKNQPFVETLIKRTIIKHYLECCVKGLNVYASRSEHDGFDVIMDFGFSGDTEGLDYIEKI